MPPQFLGSLNPIFKKSPGNSWVQNPNHNQGTVLFLGQCNVLTGLA